MSSSLLICPDSSLLLHIDPQEKLLPAIEYGETVLANAVWLTEIARRLNVPIGATVQYPRGLGRFPPALAGQLREDETVEKIHFSAVREGKLEQLAGFERRQIVVTGCEAHVCVLQTVLDLHQMGKQVFVAIDAVGSRRAGDKEAALNRLRAAGVTLVSREMIAFEWLQKAGSDVFREISREFLR